MVRLWLLGTKRARMPCGRGIGSKAMGCLSRGGGVFQGGHRHLCAMIGPDDARHQDQPLGGEVHATATARRDANQPYCRVPELGVRPDEFFSGVVSLNFRDEVMSAEYHKIRASQGT